MHDMSNLKADHRSFLPIAFARLRKTFEQKVLEVGVSLRNPTSRAHAGTRVGIFSRQVFPTHNTLFCSRVYFLENFL